MRAERCFTLLEIVIGLVVTSIVMLIVTDLLGAQAQQSVSRSVPKASMQGEERGEGG